MQPSDHAWNYHSFMITHTLSHTHKPGLLRLHKPYILTDKHTCDDSARRAVTADSGIAVEWHATSSEVLIVLPLPLCVFVCVKAFLDCGISLLTANLFLLVYVVNKDRTAEVCSVHLKKKNMNKSILSDSQGSIQVFKSAEVNCPHPVYRGDFCYYVKFIMTSE